MVFNKLLIFLAMKIKIIVFSYFILLQNSLAQTKDWQTYDLDSIVYLDMPFDVYEVDTIINSKKYYQITSIKNLSEFVAQKHYLTSSFSREETMNLPKDYKSLKKYYLYIIWTFDEISEFKLNDYKVIQKNNLKGFQIEFVNKNEILAQQMFMFLVNKKLYFFSYTNENGLNELDKNHFFKSINFNDTKHLEQYRPKPYSAYKKFLLILFCFLIVSFVLRLFSKRKKSEQINNF